jgi:hypothetical protein
MKKTGKKPILTDFLTISTEQSFTQADGRVIVRQRDVLQFELAATDEHLSGLRASISEQMAKRSRLVSRIAGLTLVLTKRGSH